MHHNFCYLFRNDYKRKVPEILKTSLEACFFSDMNHLKISLEACFFSDMNHLKISLEACFFRHETIITQKSLKITSNLKTEQTKSQNTEREKTSLLGFFIK